MTDATATVEALSDRPSRLGTRVAERALDIALGAVLLALLLPLILVIAGAIRIDSRGPAIFRQRRIGRDQRPFVVNKFRTMRTDADASRHREYVRELIARDRASTRHGDDGLYKLAVDDRITRVGRVLRRWSLDELPQIWNVIRGEMSLVGPRPVIPYEVDVYPEWYHARFRTKPGMTGLWQVSGRNERTYEEMVRLDIEYADRRSIRLYVLILVKTAWVVLRGQGVA
jgi:lipopolysaccharide/colanic/teichoic acid biosynthesis glycosyltransferase